MDAVDYSRERFDQIQKEMTAFLNQIGYTKKNVIFVPISGLTGAGVSTNFGKWYKGKPLIEVTEQIDIPDRTALRNRPFRATVNEYAQVNTDFIE